MERFKAVRPAHCSIQTHWSVITRRKCNVNDLMDTRRIEINGNTTHHHRQHHRLASVVHLDYRNAKSTHQFNVNRVLVVYMLIRWIAESF